MFGCPLTTPVRRCIIGPLTLPWRLAIIRRQNRQGHTLIELVVALALLALIAGLVAPRFLAPYATPSDDLTEVIARARRMAVERATPMRLSVGRTGEWRVWAEREPGSTLLEGRLDPPQPVAEVALTASGLCLPSSGSAWDPARCASAGAAR